MAKYLVNFIVFSEEILLLLGNKMLITQGQTNY